MTAPEWVYGEATSTCDADRAFHAGVATDLIYGNLKRAYEMSRISYQSGSGCMSIIFGEGDPATVPTLWDFAAVSTNTFYGISTMGWWPIQLRYGIDGDFRPITVRLKSRLIGKEGTLTVRVYMLNQPHGFGPAGGLVPADNNAWGDDYYSTLSYTTTTWAWDSCTLSSMDVGRSMGPRNTGVPTYTYPMAWLHFAASCTTSCSTAFAAPHFLEVTDT